MFECEEKFKILEPHIGTTTIFRVYVKECAKVHNYHEWDKGPKASLTSCNSNMAWTLDLMSHNIFLKTMRYSCKKFTLQ